MKRAWIVLGLVALALAAAWWWREHTATPAPALPPPAPPASAPAPAASAPAPAASQASTAPPAPAEPLQAAELPAALEALVGRKAVDSLLQLDQFPRRLVATVDNLGRAHAPSALWPVQPTDGRFTVDESGGAPVPAADNASRYTPLVLIAETVNTTKAVDLYLRMYPLLQQAYEQLGYPGRQFNQRLLTVIDLLLATPEPEEPPPLQLLQVHGEVPSTRPWVRWQFQDAELEGLAAGQKILLRVGLVNERRLKKKLAEFRDALNRQTAR